MITSLQNERVKSVVKLRGRRHRDETGRTVIDGFAPLSMAVVNAYPLEAVYVCRALFLGENEDSLLERAAAQGAAVFETAEEPFRKMAYRDRPDGLLAVAPARRRTLDECQPRDNALYLVLESIARPGNLGSMLRSADAAGVDAAVVCDAVTDVYNPETIRASIGTVFAVPVFEAASAEAISWLGGQGVRVVAASPHAETDHLHADMTAPIAIAVGAEQYGLSRQWVDSADLVVRIAMHGQADSLNVAAAATLLLYEAARCRDVSPPER